MQNIKKAYTDILEVCEKYADIPENNYYMGDISHMIYRAKEHLEIIRWEEEYGIKLKHDTIVLNRNYIEVENNVTIQYFQDAQKEKELGGGRSISWSDDDRQPLNEWLISISFSTGPYIFGDDHNYYRKLFDEFFGELKKLNPKYSDTANNSLYFELTNAGVIDKYHELLELYEQKAKAVFLEKRKEELQKQLDSLSLSP